MAGPASDNPRPKRKVPTAEPTREPDPRRQGKLRWTDDKQADFLEELRETANVARAARRIGYSYGGVYLRRRADPELHRLWEEAFAAGYERIEAALLARAMAEVEKGGIDGALAEAPVGFADLMKLLDRQHNRVQRQLAKGGWQARVPDPDAARAAILTAVAAIRRSRDVKPRAA